MNETALFGIGFIDQAKSLELLIRFAFNLLIVIILIRYIYFKYAKRKDYLFTYLLISSSVFLITFMLENVTLELGFALGLFAIFGILRYRTSQIPIKEMTYLFVVIGVSIINALSNETVTLVELVMTNLFVIIITYIGEYFWLTKHESSKRITYDKLELLKPENEELFIKDIKKRTGIKVRRVEIGDINFARGTADISIYYFDDDQLQRFYYEKAHDSDMINGDGDTTPPDINSKF